MDYKKIIKEQIKDMSQNEIANFIDILIDQSYLEGQINGKAQILLSTQKVIDMVYNNSDTVDCKQGFDFIYDLINQTLEQCSDVKKEYDKLKIK